MRNKKNISIIFAAISIITGIYALAYLKDLASEYWIADATVVVLILHTAVSLFWLLASVVSRFDP